MTFDRGRRAPVLAGLVAVAVGAVVAGGATAMGHGMLTPTNGGLSYAAQVKTGSVNVINAPRPSLTANNAVPGPNGTGRPARPSASTTTKTTTSKPSTSKSTPPPSSPPPTSPSNREAPSPTQTGRVLQLVNQERASAGCSALRSDDKLVNAAQAHSSDMANRGYFSHDTPEGVTFDKRIKAAGYPQPGAENIAMGQQSADEVMDAWMHSEGHRANILNCDLTAIGVGLDTNGWYWTQDFGY